MRIAHVGSKGLPSKGGTERVVEAIARLQAERHEVTVYGSRLVCRSGTVNDIRVLAMPVPAAKHLGPVVLQLLSAAHALMQPYDVVHLHGSENAFVVPLLRLRSPVVTTNHGPAYQREKWSPLARRLMRAVEGVSVRTASAATAVARNQAETLSLRYGREVTYIPNGVDTETRPDEDAAGRLLGELGLEAGGYWLFAAARVDPTKGCHTLIEAHGRLASRPPLLVVGDLYHAPGYEEELRRLAGGDVTFVPRLDDKATLLGLLRLAGLFVFPSTVEAMSMMLLEALYVGAPTLASDIPENLAVLPPGVPTFRAGNAGDLSRALTEAAQSNGSEREGLREEARDWVREHFRWEVIAERYEEVYSSVV